ncbi:MAG: hypothetical protein R3E95_10755 [Thiolinea sp.]
MQQEQRLIIRFDLPYLPLGFHTRLVKPLFNQKAGIPSSQHIWRQGFIMQQDDCHAVVQYLLRKSSIEFTLTGNPRHYARLLENFHISLRTAVAENHSGFTSSLTIRPFVFLEKQLFALDDTGEARAFSVHSVIELVKVLRAANGDLQQIYEEVKNMAADQTNETHHHYGDNYHMQGGDGANFAPNSKKATQTSRIDKSVGTLHADQRQQLSLTLDALLDQRQRLDKTQLREVIRIQDILEAETQQPSSAGQSRLNAAWQELKSIIGATNDSIGVAKEVATNWPAISGWLTATYTTLSQLHL